MKKSIVYVLDFDGVICDSAVETGISAWKAAGQLWDGFDLSQPSAALLEGFKQVRPFLGTGYESILIIKLLFDGISVTDIMNDYQAKTAQVMAESGLNIDYLKQLFGETRDNWIENDLDDWVAMNPLFPGVTEKLQRLSENNDWYIVTTKQERFVQYILNANGIELFAEHIFGLDRKLSKEEILIDLQKKHSDDQLCFVEDMLGSLIKVLNNDKLKSVKLFLALWGYNTSQDKLDAEKRCIELIDLNTFLRV